MALLPVTVLIFSGAIASRGSLLLRVEYIGVPRSPIGGIWLPFV
ncbi:MAG: hypothetical protein WCF90_10375 [Methanomicrobiales archaeon]